MSVQSLDIISVNLWQILISLANLLIIYLILKKVLFAKVQGVMNTRQSQVTEMYDAADKSRTDAESMKQEYEEKLAGARDEADKIVRSATQTAQRRGDQIVQRSQQPGQPSEAEGGRGNRPGKTAYAYGRAGRNLRSGRQHRIQGRGTRDPQGRPGYLCG